MKKSVTFTATIYKGHDTHTLQPDSIREWNELLGKFNDCERVSVKISSKSDGESTMGAIVSTRTPDGECDMQVFTELEYDEIVARNRFLIERRYRIVKEESRANLTAIYFRDEQDKPGLTLIANI